jgi:hypothetical protein
MKIIQPATYPDRGFAKIGQTKHHLTEAVLKHIDKNLSDVYEVEKSGAEYWMRSKERQTGRLIDFVEELALVDARTNRDAAWIKKVDNYYDLLSDKVTDDANAISIISSLAGQDTHKQVHFASVALMFAHSSRRDAFLRDHYFPWFFTVFPEGKILAFKFNSTYEKRLPLLRWGNLLSIYDDAEVGKIASLSFKRLGGMADLQPTGSIDAKPYFLAVSNLFYPYADSIVVGGFGKLFVLMTGEQPILDRGPYPQTSMDMHRIHTLLHGDEPDMNNKSNSREGWRGRYVSPKQFAIDELVGLFRYFVPRYNHALRLRLDVTNYRQGENIDFISAFESYFTFDRLTTELNHCQTAMDGYTSRTSSFAMLDKYSELIPITGIQAGNLFHYYVTKPFANSVLLPILRAYPNPFGMFFADECKRVYESVYDTVLGADGLWMTFRRTKTGVNAREWDKKRKLFHDRATPYTEDEFVGEIVRAVRNTHHGYISQRDERRRFAIFVSMHSGKIPDDFTLIPQLMWLSAMQDPEATILTKAITDQKLKSAPI